MSKGKQETGKRNNNQRNSNSKRRNTNQRNTNQRNSSQRNNDQRNTNQRRVNQKSSKETTKERSSQNENRARRLEGNKSQTVTLRRADDRDERRIRRAEARMLKKNSNQIAANTKRRLGLIFIAIVLCFVFLLYRLIDIVRTDGDNYNRKILTQQHYTSTTIPYKRGDIVDQNGTVLASSYKVYNVVLDAYAVLEEDDATEPTLSALAKCFGFDKKEMKDYIDANPNSRYKVLKKYLSFDEISEFKAMDEENRKITGVWFEEEYLRTYPYATLACDVIGFTNRDNEGTYGLEEYYNDTLSGSNGREYGYINEDSTVERTTIAAQDGNTIVTTLDLNVQSIVEKYILQYNQEHANEFREGDGSVNTGVIMMELDTGNILAMASYPNYDLNDPYDITNYYTEEQIQEMKDTDTYYSTLNKLWRNFCISDTYEPGSVAKPFTVATGIDSGKLSGNETYDCQGSLNVNGTTIRCHNRLGDGLMTVQTAIEKSCNVSLMHMAQTIGKEDFLEYFSTYGFGYKTNIDLAGEARTASLVFNENSMGPVELATSSFGQGFNVTMIQMATAFGSLVNGGYLYEPHMVSQIRTKEGAVIKNIEPRVLKQTISETTSEKIIDYCVGVVDNGTGQKARPAGYRIGGKTGTAETVNNGIRDKTNYVISFMGFAPADDPKYLIYVVIDRPNTQSQSEATRYACLMCKSILTEALPYLGVYMTEPVSEEEQQELNELGIYIPNIVSEEEVSSESTEIPSEGEAQENTASPEEASGQEQVQTESEEQQEVTQ